MIVPHSKLSQEALAGLIEEFILREGTDYGTHEYSLDDKKNHVFKQLQGGHINVVFDPNNETTSLLTNEQLRKLNGST
ncbi:MAG: YheU family protein [Bdellovibrionales bacterium]|nr:YheU family protein [Bdellovibrionales bacterium]